MDRIYEFDKQQGVTQAWHGKTEIVEDLTLDNNWLRKWNIAPVSLEKRGEQSRWVVLETTDLKDKIEIGSPYNPGTFKPIDNNQFLDMVKDSIGDSNHRLVSVGSLRNRGRIFASIELNGMEKFQAGGREFGAYLNFGNGHDRSSVLWINTSNTCTVCDNTFTANLYSTETKASADNNVRVTQRHTKNVALQLPKLAEVIKQAVKVQLEFQSEFERINGVALNHEDANYLFTGFIGRNMAEVKKLAARGAGQVETLVGLFIRGKGNNGKTLADAFQAVTDYYTHQSSGGENVFRQVTSSDYGAGNQAKHDFWRAIRDDALRGKLIQRGKEILAA